MEEDKNDLVEAYIVQDGMQQILVIPEFGGIFGKEGFCSLNSEIIKNLLYKQSGKTHLKRSKVELMKKSSQTRNKIVDIFNKINKEKTNNIFKD